jgi:hypothetical protein
VAIIKANRKERQKLYVRLIARAFADVVEKIRKCSDSQELCDVLSFFLLPFYE